MGFQCVLYVGYHWVRDCCHTDSEKRIDCKTDFVWLTFWMILSNKSNQIKDEFN